MLDDAGALVLSPRGARRRPDGCGRHDRARSTETRATRGRRAPPTRPPLGGGDLAYIIYTSGSTGAPKGVVVPTAPSRGWSAAPTTSRLGPRRPGRCRLHARFDAATFEIWGALLNGARLVVIPAEIALSPPRARRRARAPRRHDALPAPPRCSTRWPREQPGAFGGLRQLLFGGEACRSRCGRSGASRARPPRGCSTSTGPTESDDLRTAGMWSRGRRRRRAPCRSAGRSPTRELYVLDAHCEPVPIGRAGELLRRRRRAGRGYLGPAGADGRAVRARPVRRRAGRAALPHRRLARCRPDGTLEFLGRLDRRSRCAASASSPARSRRCCSATRACAGGGRRGARRPGERRLVAYVVPADGVAPTAADAAQALAGTSRLHGARRRSSAGGAAPDAQRQGRPRRASSADCGKRRTRASPHVGAARGNVEHQSRQDLGGSTK